MGVSWDTLWHTGTSVEFFYFLFYFLFSLAEADCKGREWIWRPGETNGTGVHDIESKKNQKNKKNLNK